MLWPDEIREPKFGFLDEDVQLRGPEKQMAASLIESMAGDFEPEQYTDEYREALQEVIQAKIEGREVVEAEESQPTAGTVVDLMSALRASVEAAKKGRGEAATSSATAARKTAAKKAPAKPAAKKTPAKKATATKRPAKKTAGKAAAKTSARKAAKKTPARKSA
jgi:DNA end-binding protein Ku